MINHLMSNSAFSSVVNQVNNKNTSQINNTKNESVDEKPQTDKSAKASSNNRLEEIKSAIKDGTYKLDLRGSAEKLAQELLR